MLTKRTQAWDQSNGESDEAFLTFLHWLHSKPRRTPPPGLAAKFNWTERANAYDALLAGTESEADPMRELLQNLWVIATVETRKLAKQSQLSGCSVITLRDIMTVASFLTQIQVTMSQALGADEDFDLAQLTDEQAREFTRHMQAIERLQA